jgi:hypothetical protein
MFKDLRRKGNMRSSKDHMSCKKRKVEEQTVKNSFFWGGRGGSVDRGYCSFSGSTGEGIH